MAPFFRNIELCESLDNVGIDIAHSDSHHQSCTLAVYRVAVTKKPLVGMNRHLVLPEIKASYVLHPLMMLPQCVKIGALFCKGAFLALS
jgi:hypothetical protein